MFRRMKFLNVSVLKPDGQGKGLALENATRHGSINEVIPLFTSPKSRGFIVISLLLGLLLSLFQPVPAAAGADKVHPQVRAALSGRDFVQVLIKLSAEQDPHEAARAALSKLPDNAPSAQRKLAARQGVLDSLQAAAASSQGQLLSLLTTAAQNGLAREIRSYYIVNIIYAEIHPSLILSFARHSDVAAVLPNVRISQADSVLKTAGTRIGSNWNLERIGASSVHNSGINGNGITVGLIDTGVDWTHPDLNLRWRGHNPAGSANPELNWFDAVNGRAMPYDDDGHGTHVAGIIVGENTGVAPGASWIAVKAFDEYGDANSEWLLKAGQYMLAPLDAAGTPHPEMAPDLINNSWGKDAGLDEWYRPMVQAWRAAGILPVFAAGNGEGPASIFNPANYPESLAVAASGRDNDRSSFSTTGPSPYPEIIKPDLTAPGEGIVSTTAGGGYSQMSGTSAAAAHVSGAAALLLSADGSLDPDALEAVMKQSALPLSDSNYTATPNLGYGYGLIQAAAALSFLQDGVGVIRGKVTADISGATPPKIQHSPFDKYYTGVSLPISAWLEDKHGIAKAEVIIWDANTQDYLTFSLGLNSGDNKSGEWSGWLPYEHVSPPSLEYTLKAVNRAGLVTLSGPYLLNLVSGIVPPFVADFSEYPPGWIADGEWQWGIPGRQSPQPRLGKTLFGTGLDHAYSPGSWNALYAPPLDLRGVTGASLEIWHWFDLAPGDYGQVFISKDEFETWEVLETFQGTSQGWEPALIDLSPWDNWPTPLLLGFDLIAGENGGGRPGWFIDGFRLAGTDSESQSQAAATQGSTTTNLGFTGSIPLEAVITVVETGYSTRTGYTDGIFAGSFFLLHPFSSPGGTYTLRVDARGYHPLEKQFTLAAAETLDFDLTLTPLEFSFQRLSGSNRFATAAAISQEGWSSAETVFLARGDNYADALAGVPLAHALNAPVLLTATAKLPEVTRAELVRLGAKKVYILGGGGAVSPEIEAILALELGLDTERLSGANRFATAAEIARRLALLTNPDKAIVVYGNNFPDALAAAPHAAAKGLPILLAQTNSLPEATAAVLAELGIQETIVAGGSGVISAGVCQQLPQPLRLEGSTRYYTAVALAEYFLPPSSKLYLATGRDFADAICGAVLAARNNAALLLVGNVVPLPVTEFILKYGTEEIYLLGGKAILPENISEGIRMLEPEL